MNTKSKPSLIELSLYCTNRLSHIYSDYLNHVPSLELKSAMEYSLLNGGKQLRPLLIYASGTIFNAPLECLDIPACAVELIHTYSLIHDDLPCMDNADLRRGKPTCHTVYNEGTAVLTGDALHTLAMQIISAHPAPLKANKRLLMIKTLSHACGPYGMAAGQAIDLFLNGDDNTSLNILESMLHLKTGALITACVELGWLASLDDNDNNLLALRRFGNAIGLAFQIQDDILDIESNTSTLGKPQGQDQINHKMTYPKLIGIEKAKEKVDSLYQDALEAINYLGDNAEALRELARKMVERDK